MSTETLQTIALCVGSGALVVIALASVVITVRLIALVTPFDLIRPLDEDEEAMIDVIDEAQPKRKRRR